MDANKAKKFAMKRAARAERKEQRAYALDWGKDRGISRDRNKLLWDNRQEHDNIAKWLAAASWNDASGINRAANYHGPFNAANPAPTAVNPYVAGSDPNRATMGPATFSTDPRLRGARYFRGQARNFLDTYNDSYDELDDVEERIMRRRMYDLIAQLRNHPSDATNRWGYNKNQQHIKGLEFFMRNKLGDAGYPITD
jgi:hypothetical protein